MGRLGTMAKVGKFLTTISIGDTFNTFDCNNWIRENEELAVGEWRGSSASYLESLKDYGYLDTVGAVYVPGFSNKALPIYKKIANYSHVEVIYEWERNDYTSLKGYKYINDELVAEGDVF